MVLIVGGIAFMIWVVAGPLGNCVPDPNLAQQDCNPSNVLFVGLGAAVLGVVSLFVGIPLLLSRPGGSAGVVVSGPVPDGIPASARILSVAETGVTVNESPQVDLTLLVTVPGRPPYEIERRELVPRLAIGRLTDGRPLRVLVDPQEPGRVAVDWLAQPWQIPGASPESDQLAR